MVSESSHSSSFAHNHNHNRPNSFHLSNSTSKRILSELVGDIVIDVDGQSFLLHKFPLLCRSGRIRKMVADFGSTDLPHLELFNVPGGPQTFELATKFCYGKKFEIITSNVVQLHCIAEYLEMTEEYREENLINLTETYLNQIVFPSLEKCVQVLCACETVLSFAEELGIVNRCIDAIAMNASKEQLYSGLANLDFDVDYVKPKVDYEDWWVEDLALLNIDLYQRVISALKKAGVRSDSITTSFTYYAQHSLKGIRKHQMLDSGIPVDDKHKRVVEALVSLLVNEKITTVPMSFLFGMLRMATVVDAGFPCRQELERRIALQMEMVSLDDLLIPSLQSGDSMFDVDTVHRILGNFLQTIEEDNDDFFDGGYESDSGNSPNHSSILKVGRTIDAFLAEIAADPSLKLHKFISLIELLPDYARVVEDGLYRAIDIYLKAHPSLTESECKKLCKLIDCQKLSQEASNHAAQNDRLPVQMVVRVLYFEQVRLKSSFSCDSGEGFFSHRIIMGGSGVPSAAVSPRDNYASLRRENRELKLEISRMRVRLSDLEKEQESMKQGIQYGKSGDHGGAFFAALARGFGRVGLFGSAGGQPKKCSRKSQSSEAKMRRQHKHSSS